METIVIEKNGQVSLGQRVKDAVFVGAVGATTALVPFAGANAGELDLTGATTEITGTKTAVLGVIGVLVTLIGIFLAWSYFKRGAK